MRRRMSFLILLSLFMVAGVAGSFGEAVVSTSIAAGTPLTPGQQFNVQVTVTSNDTGQIPQAPAFRVHYPISSVSYVSTLQGQLGAVVVGNEEQGVSDQFRDILTYGNYNNTDPTPVCFTVVFQLNAAPASDFDIWVEGDPGNEPLVDVEFNPIPHSFDNSATLGLLPSDDQVNVECGLSSPAWEFNKEGNFEGWTVNNQFSSPAVTGGAFVATSVGNDPQMYSPNGLGITARYQNSIEIRMKATQGTVLNLFYKSSGDPTFTAVKRVGISIPNNSDFVTYKLDMEGIGCWVGIIDQFRLDPTNATGASVEIDYIRVRVPMCVKAPKWEFNVEGDKEGWLSSATVMSFGATGGVLNGLTTGFPVSITSPVIDRPIDAMIQTDLELRYKQTAGASFRVYFLREGGNAYAGFVEVPVTDNSDFVNYNIDLSSSAAYTNGIIRYQIRPNCPVGTTVQIDYFRICMPIMDYRPSWKFDADGNTEGWFGNNVGPLEVANGRLTTTSTSTDPNLYSPSSIIDTRFARMFVLGMNPSDGNLIDVFYRRVGSSFNATNKVRINLNTPELMKLYLADLGTTPDYGANDIHRLRVDPTNASGASISIESMGMLDEVMRTRSLGEFNSDGDNEGWLIRKNLGSVKISNGTLQATSTGIDSQLVTSGDLMMNSDNIESIVIRMKVSSGTLADLFYLREGDVGFSSLRRVRFNIENNGDFVTYNLTMSNDLNWSGSIKTLRFDPTNNSSAKVEIDYVRAYGPSQFGVPEWRWNFTGDLQGWTASGDVALANVASGYLRILSNATDPILYSPQTLNINASIKKWAVVRMRSDRSGIINLFYRGGAQSFSGDRRKDVSIEASTEFETYQLYMGNDPNWTGTVTGLRFDPINVSGATVDIDHLIIP